MDIHGRWRLSRLTAAGRIDGPWRPNTIQFALYTLTQALLVQQAGYTGWQYLAVGTGDQTWDGLTNPPPAPPDAGGLIAEFARLPLVSATNVFVAPYGYLDAHGNVVTDLSRVVQLQATISGGVLGETLSSPRTFRELALVGGNATAALGSGMYLAVERIPREVRFEGDDPLIITIEIEV